MLLEKCYDETVEAAKRQAVRNYHIPHGPMRVTQPPTQQCNTAPRSPLYPEPRAISSGDLCLYIRGVGYFYPAPLCLSRRVTPLRGGACNGRPRPPRGRYPARPNFTNERGKLMQRQHLSQRVRVEVFSNSSTMFLFSR